MYVLNDKSPRLLPDASASMARSSATLTYEPFYGLREKPFSLSADPRFLFRSPAHGPAFDELQAGIRRREGLIVLTGEIGTGKTTLCRSVLEGLDRRTFASFVADPFVSREDLLKTLLVDFGVISIGDLTRGKFSGASRSDLSYPLYEFLDSLVPLQAFAVVVIDEAQNLSLPLLEEIRILSELERREKLLQVVLVGQPELRANLKLPQMRQVDQRVSVRCELTALEADGVAGYVNHRLGIAAAGESRVEFSRAALDAIHQGASGVPRLINRICDRALQRAHAARSLRIDAPFVWDAIADLGLGAEPGTPGRAVQETAAPRPAVAKGPVAVPVPVPVPAPVPAPPAASVPPPVPLPAPVPVSAPVPGPELALAPATVPVPPMVMSTDRALPSPGLDDFIAEADQAAASAVTTSAPRRAAWLAGALASCVVISAALGAPSWHARAQSAGPGASAALLPPPPTSVLPQRDLVLPRLAPAVPVTVPADNAVATAVTVPAAGPTPAPAGEYAIVVASFESRTRADRLVEELTSAGYRAGAVERDGGPQRGRLLQVNVGGYGSAIEVQRDLQRIRELPGGYTDARIVERE